MYVTTSYVMNTARGKVTMPSRYLTVNANNYIARLKDQTTLLNVYDLTINMASLSLN